MTENLLQFIWQHGYFNTASLATAAGDALTILYRGTLNKNQGPDFENGRISLFDTTLAGTIELHLKTSDWRRHRHQTDKRYDNVILHVVYEHDENVNNIPVLEIGNRISSLLIDRYTKLMTADKAIACSRAGTTINEIVWIGWKERLLAERLSRKANQIIELHKNAGHHWEELFWWQLAKGLGGKVNAEAFEALARSIPINLLAKHKHSIHQIEALLFGQAGLLNEPFEDSYPLLLQREYRFLKQKYKLHSSPLPVSFLRMRPGSFPTVRLAQLATVICQTNHLFSTILETDELSLIEALFSATANDFWHYHYTLTQTSAYKPKMVGRDAVHHIIINCIAPILFAYGTYHRQEAPKAKALRWLEELPAEENHISRAFARLQLSAKTAFESQALIELKNEYCTGRRCLHCAVGASLLREATAAYG